MRSLSHSATMALGFAASGASAFTGMPLARAAAAAGGIGRGALGGAARRAHNLVMAEDVALKQKGEAETQEYRVFFTKGGNNISPWHDIPLKVRGGFSQCICWYQCMCRVCVVDCSAAPTFRGYQVWWVQQFGR